MLQGLQPPQKEALCPLMVRVAKLDKKDAEAVIGYLADPRWTNSALSDALTKNDFPISETPLWRHRAGRCACAK